MGTLAQWAIYLALLAAAGVHITGLETGYNKIYFAWAHVGCSNTPDTGSPSGYLCPPYAGTSHLYDAIWFPPKPFSRNGCLGHFSQQPDVEIDPVGGNW